MKRNPFKELAKDILAAVKRRRLRNRGFTLIANNCCGGIIYHSLGEKFQSPTINLFICTDDYFCFLEHLEEALKADVYEIKVDKTGNTAPFPIGEMCLSDGSTIQIHFVHYATFDEAKRKWDERCRRVNMNSCLYLWNWASKRRKIMLKNFRNYRLKIKLR